MTTEVDVPLLLKEPLRALLPMLVKVRGWEQVRPLLPCRMLICSAEQSSAYATPDAVCIHANRRCHDFAGEGG